MKTLIAVFCAAFVLGCGAVGLQKPETPICDTLHDSWICTQSHNLKIKPENVYGWLYSAAAIAGIKDTKNLTAICKFEGEIASWYASAYPLTYDSVIDEIIKRSELFSDPTQVLLIKGIINKNLVWYKSPDLIKPDDDYLLRLGHTKFRQDLFCD